MKRKYLLIIFLISTLALSFNTSTGEPQETDDILGLPEPTVVFIYPEAFTNGSSFPIGEYIYFTMTGNLSLFNYPDTRFELTINFDNGSAFEPEYNQGYGTWIILPRHSKNLALDEWHTLNITKRWFNTSINPPSGVLIEEFSSNMSLFADSAYFAEDLSITPVNYPNNSEIPYALSTFHDERSLPIFKATGWKSGDMAEIDSMPDSWAGVRIGKPVAAYYVWNNGSTWNNLTTQVPFHKHHNEFVLKPEDMQVSDWNTLTIKIENDTHALNTTFRYFVTQRTPFDFDRWYFGADGMDGDIHHLTTERSIIFQNQTFNNQNVPLTVKYNLNDGSGNQTLNGSSFSLPAWNSSYAGYHYISYWIEMDNYTNSFGMVSDFPMWTPEYRMGFLYESIVPQINLNYPINDTGKSGVIPLIWNLDTNHGGWWNYSNYKFNIYYETDTIPQTLAREEWTPITSYTHSARNKEARWYYKSAFQMFQRSAPALYSFEFNLTEALEGGGAGASTMRTIQDTTEIRFIIEETTTNAVYNETQMKFKLEASYASTSSESIQGATSGWINAVFGSYAATADPDKTSSTINVPPNSSETTNGAPIPFGSPFVILIAVALLGKNKRKQN